VETTDFPEGIYSPKKPIEFVLPLLNILIIYLSPLFYSAKVFDMRV